MTEYRDPDNNPLAIVPLENYTFLTSRILSWNANVFGVVHSPILQRFSNAPGSTPKRKDSDRI
jgi:hypothetical protein